VEICQFLGAIETLNTCPGVYSSQFEIQFGIHAVLFSGCI